MRAWSKFKNVSHFYAAMQALIKSGMYDPIERIENAKSLGLDYNLSLVAIDMMFFQAFINIAMHLGKMACEKTDKRTKNALIDLRKTWTVDKKFIERARDSCREFGFKDDQILEINCIPFFPFSEADLKVLGEYRAGPR